MIYILYFKQFRGDPHSLTSSKMTHGISGKSLYLCLSMVSIIGLNPHDSIPNPYAFLGISW